MSLNDKQKSQLIWLLDYSVAVFITGWIALEVVHYYYQNHGVDIPLPNLLNEVVGAGGVIYGLVQRFLHLSPPTTPMG